MILICFGHVWGAIPGIGTTSPPPPTPVYKLLQGPLEGGPEAPLQPELGVVGVAEVRAALVQVGVHQRVVGLAPVLQAAVDPLHQEVHHAPVGGVADEQHLCVGVGGRGEGGQ